MGYLGEAASEAIRLIATGDPGVFEACWASIRFSLASTLLASMIGIPAGAALALTGSRLKKPSVAVLQTLLAMPTVIVGLFVYALVFNKGPLGPFGLLFTPWAIILGQTILIVPIIAALTYNAVDGMNIIVLQTAQTLGAGPWRTGLTVVREARSAVLAACILAFGRVIGEVGISMMLGGNIAGYTRTITTVIALETAKGQFALGLALGILLLIAAFAVNLTVRTISGESR